MAHGLSCSTTCEIFLDQGSNPCPLHWQADSQPLHHQGSPPFTSDWSELGSEYHFPCCFCLKRGEINQDVHNIYLVPLLLVEQNLEQITRYFKCPILTGHILRENHNSERHMHPNVHCSTMFPKFIYFIFGCIGSSLLHAGFL